MKIAAVVVTFNRSALLIECLQGLVSQTRRVDKIFVLDNCSSDDTPQRMASFCTDHPQVAYRRLDSNTGGAGGFAQAMQWAWSEGFDWLWLVDDDVEPYPEGLQNLLAFSDRSRCIHGVRTEPDGEAFPWGSQFVEAVVDTVALPQPLPQQPGAAIEINVGCFEGMLVHRDVISQIGFPWPELFITWDDTYFGFCASKVTPVLYARVNSLKRKRTMDRVAAGILGTKMSMTAMGNFYHHRNRYMLATRLQPAPFRFWVRNAWVYGKSMAKELLLRRDWANARSIHQGTCAGLMFYRQAK